MRLIWNAEGVLEFVSKVSGHTDFGNHKALAVVDDNGQLAAGIIFHDWQPEYGTIEMSMVATTAKWASRAAFSEIGRYCFEDADCQAIIARTDGTNLRVRRLLKGLGAKEYIIPRLRGREASEAVLLLTDEAWAKSKKNRLPDEIKFTSPAP